ncbi:DNAJC3 [Cordylochernes scorpioides]|uniref:DNAJC3 n=1 Tax=Cordylochernes scorpioides TaxID=51811 RepID=A0ABY6L700_9ARAC|nr:DNAJC3 [Cordylochernes scorpioides]
MTHFKRATVYLALGRAKPATDDLDRVIQLKPDFAAARYQRGTLLLKQGRLDEAHIDLEWVDVPWDYNLREVRAKCFEAIGDKQSAINDLRAATKLHKDNTEGYLKLSKLSYDLADLDDALNSVRECLKVDPDHKPCFSHYKSLRKVSKDLEAVKRLSSESDFAGCISRAQAALENPHPDLVTFEIKSRLCSCQLKYSGFKDVLLQMMAVIRLSVLQGGEAEAAVSTCSDAIKLNPNAHTYCDRADAHIAADNFEEALRDYQEAANLEPDLNRAQSGIQKTQKLIRQAKKRDYYKILGVKRPRTECVWIPRTANKKEILRAYRKLAQKWHPDNFRGDEKQSAQNKFIDIAAAKEVLSDPEKRQKFDNGEDPLDPEAQANQGFHPFGGQGFQHFTFKFNW